MNTAQLAAQRRELDAEKAEIDRLIDQAISTKSYGAFDGLKDRLDAYEEARVGLELAEKRAAASGAMAARLGGIDAASQLNEDSGTASTGDRLTFGRKMAEGLVSRKSLATSGAAVVGQEFRPDPIALGKPATGLLDVLPTVPHSSPLYAYLRQNTRTNNAAVVADGNVKPTSTYGVTRIEQSLSVIAHLSEGIPHYWLSDNPTLTGFVQAELDYGLRKAVEAKVLADINATSGIVLQSWATSIPVTIRKAMTALETTGYTASAIVLHPSDFETIELALSSTNAVEHLGLPYDPAQRRLYGVPIATTIAQTAGVGHVLADGAAAVDLDTLGVQLTWSETSNSDDWSKNLVRARLEGRYGTSVYVPGGVVKATLASS
ncbi:phage major capsid protein [Mycolicibacterium sp. CH28]|uniref:phage major capsid protein n=1 Tax=Mycolicibacterium sp. CH28 TaxID=2512237 RepID=UPI001080C517|nr:phage major capsid protein [Mycolicibacterium sp. CH28]TGD90568.1 phage major capsid protein [Mycolicibacterium sp. CH28]